MTPTDAVRVLRVGRLYEADMVAQALQDAKIPFYRRVESGGMELAMPAAATPRAGAYWLIYVHPIALEDAKAIIATLPLTDEEPEVYDFGPSEKGKKFFLLSARVQAIMLLLGIIAWVVGLFR